MSISTQKSYMKPLVSIIMGSSSDMSIMEETAKVLEELAIPVEINALSAHRTPDMVADFARNALKRGVKVIIAGAGGAAHLPGVVAAYFPLPVIGVPIKSSNSVEGIDSLLSMVQMPAGVPVATVSINGSRNAGILAAQIIATGDESLQQRLFDFKERLKEKVVKANEEIRRKK